MPNIEVKLRRGTTAQHSTFTGAEGEVTVDTDKDTVVVHDGTTAGGYELLKGDNSNLNVGASAVVVNENGADVDLRVEGDTDANLINTNAANNTVAIGKVAGSTFKLDVNGGTTNRNILNVEAEGTNVSSFIKNASSSGISTVLQLVSRTGTDSTASLNLDLQAGFNEYFQISFNNQDQCAYRFTNSTGSTNSGAFFPSHDETQELGLTDQRWNNVYAVKINLLGNVTWTTGTGTPEGTVTAPVGSLFSRTDGGAGTSLYVKESGVGNTGWVAK